MHYTASLVITKCEITYVVSVPVSADCRNYGEGVTITDHLQTG